MTLWNQPKLISHKIWVVGKWLNCHTVQQKSLLHFFSTKIQLHNDFTKKFMCYSWSLHNFPIFFSGAKYIGLDFWEIGIGHDIIFCPFNYQLTCSKLPQKTAQEEIIFQRALSGKNMVSICFFRENHSCYRFQLCKSWLLSIEREKITIWKLNTFSYIHLQKYHYMVLST